MPAPLDALFVRWRTSGQPEPLGELFNRASPQLLAVALHLCPHPADAEDALQASFVAAIDAAAKWDAARPLMPWLTGILTKQCRRIGERRARRREQELPAEPLVLEDGSPVAASERKELVAKLREHIDRLPAEQRQVLLLQLEHGLAPAEVAEVLGVPPGTVRMRLHRGVHALRGVLPASLVALLMAALPSRGVAAVRTAVVGHGIAAVAIGGGMLAKKPLAVAAVLALLAIGAAVLAPWRQPPPAATPAAPSPATASLDRGESVRGVAPLEEMARVDAGLSATVAAEPVANAGGTLVVHTVHEDGSPVPNQPFRYWLEQGEANPIARAGVTDAHGEARIAGLGAGTWSVELLGRSRTEVPAAGEGEVRFVFDAHYRPYLLHVCVEHADGRPAAGATVVLGRFMSSGAAPIGVTDADGRFVVELITNITVGARLAGFAPAPLTYCYPRDSLRLVLGGREAIVDGEVVDAGGVPVRGATVEIAAGRGWVPEPSGEDAVMPPATRVESTDEQGRCHFDALPSAPLCVRIHAAGCATFEARLATVEGEVTAARWQLVPGEALRGRVVDAEGNAVHASITVGGHLGEFLQTGTDGCFTVPHAPRDVAEVQIAADGFVKRVVAAAALRTATEPIVLQRWPTYELRLLDERAQPLADWKLCLQPHVVRDLTTDAAGRARGHARGVPPQLWVGPPDAECAVVQLAWPANALPGVPCDVVVPDACAPTATVRGTVLGTAGEPVRALVELRAPNGLWFARLEAKDGRFELGHVPAGNWSLFVHRRERNACDPLREVAGLRRGEVRDLGALAAPAEGTVHLRLHLVDGGRPRGVRTLFFAGPEFVLEYLGDDEALVLPCGDYRWQVYAEDACWSSGAIEVRADVANEVDVELSRGVHRSLAVVLPLPPAQGTHRFTFTLRDASGRIAFDSGPGAGYESVLEVHPTLAPGRWFVDVVADDGARFAASFEVDGALSSAPIEVQATAVR